MSSSLRQRLGAIKRIVFPPEPFVPNYGRDIPIVTYPRSGTTWLSFIGAQLLYGRTPERLNDIGDYVIGLHQTPLLRRGKIEAERYLLKSHSRFCDGEEAIKFKKVVYVIRDPRDVLLSYYRYWLNDGSGYSNDLRTFAEDWVAGRIWPCSWHEHVESWLGPRSAGGGPEILLLRYEDLVSDTENQITRFSQFIDVDAGTENIRRALLSATPEKMRDREIAQRELEQKQDQWFIGQAKPGVWKGKLSPDIAELVETSARKQMERFGYLPDSTETKHAIA